MLIELALFVALIVRNVSESLPETGKNVGAQDLL